MSFTDDQGGERGSANHFDSGGGAGAGRFGTMLTRIFENPDNPLGWSIRVFSAIGIAVRVHLLTFLFVAVWVVRSISFRHEGWIYSSLAMASLLVVILVHEFGHCIACRRAGGVADRIVMLPFGGLALARPPHRWSAHLLTTLGGPLVNVAILPVTAIALMLLGLGEHVVFNPLAWTEVLGQIQGATTLETTLMAGVWVLHYVNVIILGINVLVPAYPLDGGRIVQAIAWRSMGYQAGTEMAVVVGLVASMILLVVGIALDQILLAVIAGFAVWSCWAERRRIRGEEELATPSYGIGSAGDLGDDELGEDLWSERKRERQREREERDQVEVDRLLVKIADHGMESLTRKERKTLHSATKRRQRD